jgi:hypothetical protein
MKQTKKMRRLLERMAKIEQMERGRLCRMSGRPHYNHQTWHEGRNVVRYVPLDQTASVQKAIDGYALFKKLAEQYADEVIRITRRKRTKACRKAKTKRARQKQQRTHTKKLG